MKDASTYATSLGLPVGLYEIVEPERVGQRSLEGWTVVLEVRVFQIVLDRTDTLAQTDVPEPNGSSGDYCQYCRRNAVHPQTTYEHGVPNQDPRIVSLWRTTHVEATRFLMCRDESSVIAEWAKLVEQAKSDVKFAKNERAAADKRVAVADAKTKEATELAEHRKELLDKKLVRERDLEAAQRRAEAQSALLRSENEKFRRAVGDLRTKEILEGT